MGSLQGGRNSHPHPQDLYLKEWLASSPAGLTPALPNSGSPSGGADSFPTHTYRRHSMKTIELLLERFILLSRWLLVPLYLALIAILILFAVKAYQEVIHLFAAIATITETDLVLAALALVDLALVANLLVMVVLSSYETFVSNHRRV